MIKEYRITKRAVTLLAFAALLLPGCVTMDTQLTEEQKAQRADATYSDLQVLKRTVDEHIKSTRGDASSADRLAQLGVKVDAFERDIQLLKGKIEELERATTQTSGQDKTAEIESVRESLAELATRVDSLTKQLSARPAVNPTTPPAKVDRPPSKTDLKPKTPTTPPEDPKKLYDQGYALYQQNKYEEARKTFNDYIRKYSDTSLTDNSYFWVGESYYNEGQYEKAIIFYDKIVREFSNGDKVPSALLKQAFAFDALGDELDAKILLKKVIKEHPRSEQAAVARRKLQVLGD